jgi:creatinine amidohydrolase
MARWAEMAAPEVSGLAGIGAVALWPVGSTEQHGTHLVTGFDLASAQAVCDRAAAQATSAVIVLPGLPLGASDHWLPLGATLSLRPATLTGIVLDVARSLDAAGFEHLVIVNGHAGNVGPMLSAIAELSGGRPIVELVSYWMLLDDEAVAAASKADAGGVGHAGEFETSIGLYLGHGLVVEERLPAPAGIPLGDGIPGSGSSAFLRPPRPLEESPSGVYGDPRPARPEFGEFAVEGASRALAQHCDAIVESRRS